MNADDCPLTEALKSINGKYDPLIIHLLFMEEMRYNDLLHSIDGITARALSSSLKKLLKDNIIEKIYKENRFLYKLTENGLKLKDSINDLENWYTRNKYLIRKIK